MASITYRKGKKGITARIRVSAGYDAEGRQLMCSTTCHPPAGLTGEALHRYVEEAAARYERSVLSGSGRAGAPTQTLAEFCRFYLDNRQGHLSATTMHAYEQVIEAHILPRLGHLRLCDIQTRDVRMFVDALADPEARCDERDGRLQPRTIHKIYSVLRSVMALAVDLDILESSPCRPEKVRLPRIDEPQVQFYTVREAEKLLCCLASEPLKWRCLVTTALFTGMRRGEMLALRWDDIDFTSGAVRVTKSQYKLAGQETQIKNTKTPKSVRTLYLPPQVIELLRSWREEQARTFPARTDLPVFTNRSGGPLSPDCFTATWRNFLKKYGLPHRKLHALRHTTATLLLSAGHSLADVSAQLGHSNLKTTAIYTHALADSSRRASMTMEKMFLRSAGGGL